MEISDCPLSTEYFQSHIVVETSLVCISFKLRFNKTNQTQGVVKR